MTLSAVSMITCQTTSHRIAVWSAGRCARQSPPLTSLPGDHPLVSVVHEVPVSSAEAVRHITFAASVHFRSPCFVVGQEGESRDCNRRLVRAQGILEQRSLSGSAGNERWKSAEPGGFRIAIRGTLIVVLGKTCRDPGCFPSAGPALAGGFS